jgi:hypothetical protein
MVRKRCEVGFVPSHTSTDGAPVTAFVGHEIHNYGGWYFQVKPAASCKVADLVYYGWTALLPRAAAVADTSAYATTAVIPAVPAGSAVELAVPAGTVTPAPFCGLYEGTAPSAAD